MRNNIVIGLGAALAAFTVGVTEASASCRNCRHCGPAAGYGYGPPPASGYIPRVSVYGYTPPPAYYDPPARVYDRFLPRPATFGYRGYGYAPAADYDGYRPVSVWIQIR